MILTTALVASSVAEAGLLVDWWVPRDGSCPVTLQASEQARRTAGDDISSCRMESSTPDTSGDLKVDWRLVVACMERRGWHRTGRAAWQEWSSGCAAATQQEDRYLVITEALVAEYALQISPAAPGAPIELLVPPGLLGRRDAAADSDQPPASD